VEVVFGTGACVVVTDPARDSRLHPLLAALPEPERRQAGACQHVALRIRGSETARLLPATVFLAVVHPPHRLSHTRAHQILRMLERTLRREPRRANPE
jgi:hypothetical protein